MIPMELRKKDRWVCYRKENKQPVSPVNGIFNIDIRKTENLTDYKTACLTAETHDDLGVGFVLGDGVIGIDFDHCVEDGRVDETVMELIAKLNSYTELSHSGTGIHVLLNGKLPAGGNRGKLTDTINIEMYDNNRYFTMTGRTLRGFTGMRSSTDVVAELHETYCKRPQTPVPADRVSRLCEDVEKQLVKAKTDKVFLSYYNGERVNGDESVDDLGFMQKIVFWFGRDYDTCIKVFLSSPHYESKSDRHKAKCERPDYLPRTWETANIRQEESYFDENSLRIRGGADPNAPFLSFPNTDKGNAQRFTSLYEDIVKYDHNLAVNKGWLVWNGQRWTKDDTAQVYRFYNSMLDKMYEQCLEIEDEKSRENFAKWVHRCGMNSTTEATMREVAKMEGISTRTDVFDNKPFLFNCDSGTINLNTFMEKPHDSSDMLSQISPVPLGNGTPHRWVKFIDEITDGNKELGRYLQKCIGYSMTGYTDEQCVFFLYGMGANGKSTFLDIVTAIFGDYAKNVESRTLMVKKHDSSANSDIARLKGSRLVTAVESNEGAYLDESLIKHLTGGEIVTARFLYGNEFQFVPQFKIWMATNHKPTIQGTDKGIWRRIKLIPFTVTFDEKHRDLKLKDKLLAELPDILGWALEGAKMWRAEGLSEPAIVTNAINEYKADMNSVGRFVEECIIVTNDKNDAITSTALYENYKQWATAHLVDIDNLNRFGRKVSNHMPIKSMSNGRTVYRGVRTVDNFDELYGEAPVESFTSTKSNIIRLSQASYEN